MYGVKLEGVLVVKDLNITVASNFKLTTMQRSYRPSKHNGEFHKPSTVPSVATP